MRSDYIQLNEENSSFHNENLNNNINFNNVNTTYTPQLTKLETHYDGNQNSTQSFAAPVYIQPIKMSEQPQPIFIQPPPKYQPPPPPPNVIVKAFEDENHFNSALAVFIVGFFISCLWLINIRYLKSKDKNTKTLANVSIVLFVIYIIFVIIIIIASSVSTTSYSQNYNYD
ncbi:hypothetical protein ACTA71_002381 [Dictyostelium dimigraforme]